MAENKNVFNEQEKASGFIDWNSSPYRSYLNGSDEYTLPPEPILQRGKIDWKESKD